MAAGYGSAKTGRRHSFAVALVCALAFLATLPSDAIGESVFDPSLPRVIVEFTEMPVDVWQRFAEVGITHAALFPSADAAAVVGPQSAYESIAGWGEVVSVMPDEPFQLYMWQAIETTRVNLVRVGAQPLKSPYTGKGVTIAVVDMGIDTAHPDLAGDKVVTRLNFAPSRIFYPTDATLSEQDPILEEPFSSISDPLSVDDGGGIGHGTMVGGVAAGTGVAAQGADMRGVAPGATLVDLDIGDVLPYGSSIIAAFEWLGKHKDDPLFPGGVRVAVGGWGTDCRFGNIDRCGTPVLRKLLNKLIDRGLVVVLPADIAEDGDLIYPARYSEMISVKGACKDQDDWSGLCEPDRVWGSFTSKSIDVVAPGAAVWTVQASQSLWQGSNPTWSGELCEQDPRPEGCSPVPGEPDPEAEQNNQLWYGVYNSHSVSTAHVAGVAALMLEANPELTHPDIVRILQRTARDLGVKGFDERSGYGMVDAFKEVKDAERP